MAKQLPIILLVVGLLVGVFIGFGLVPRDEGGGGGITLPGTNSARVAELEQQVADLDARLERARVQFPGEITFLSGKIVSLGDGSFTLGELQLTNPVADIPETVTVAVGEATIVSRTVYKNSATFAREQAEFFEEIGPSGLVPEGVVPPQPFTLQRTTFDTLNAGMIVKVDAGQDIEGMEAFTATSIDIVQDAASGAVSE